MTLPRILITPGEPAGIGPDVVIQAAQENWPVELIAIADPAILNDRALMLGLPLTIIECELNDPERCMHQAGSMRVYPIHFASPVIPGVLNVDHAATILHSLQLGAAACLAKEADAIVTGPVHKGIMNDAGIRFSGHTEFFAEQSGVAQTVMLFVVDALKAAIVTTHIPLKDVPAAITAEKISSVLTIMHHDLKKYFGLSAPCFLVAGLNPHAGENGHMGKEEITVIQPALERLRQQGIQIIGPLPADTIFTPSVLQSGDAVLGMYHDQILPAIKQLGFDRAVNMTLGLPFIRTSVDHGTALSLAGQGVADAGSLKAAINLAISVQPSSTG